MHTHTHVLSKYCVALHVSGDTQVVGMSATLSNIDELARFLRAEVYSNDFRPVRVCAWVHCVSVCVCISVIHLT